MKRKSFLTINNEISTPKLVKPFLLPHIHLEKGLKMYENFLSVIKKYSNQKCFLEAAVKSYLRGTRLLKEETGDNSVETIWLNAAKARKRVETIIKELNQTILGSMVTMNSCIKNLGLAKIRLQTAVAKLQKHVLKSYGNKIERLAAAGPAKKEELEKTRLKHKELFDMKIFLFELKKQQQANRSFFGVTNKFKSTELSLIEKKKVVSQLQKALQENTLSMNLSQKELYENLMIYETIKREMTAAGQSFQNRVIASLREKCISILRSIGISKKQATRAKACLSKSGAAANGLKPLSVDQIDVRESTKDDPDYVPPAPGDADDGSESEDDDGFIKIPTNSKVSKAVLRNEAVDEDDDDDDFDTNEFLCDGEKGDIRYQVDYHERSSAIKQPRIIPIPFLPRPELVLHESFQNVLNLLQNDDDDDDDETSGNNNKPAMVLSWNEENCNVLDVALTKMYAKVVQMYSEVYPFMSPYMRSQFSGVFSTANDIQQFQRRRREMETQKRAKKREKEEAAAVASSSDEDQEYDSDFSYSSSDDDDNDGEEMEGETLDFWNLRPAARAKRIISILPNKPRDDGVPIIGGIDGKALTLPSEIAAVVKEPFIIPPHTKKNKRFTYWEEGNPNSGNVLERTLDTASSVSAPAMPLYTGLVLGRFCIVCCQVVHPPDLDCICTDYRGLKRSQCEDGIFYSTLRMRNAAVPLRRNVRDRRSKPHRRLWSIWRNSQRDLLLNGHQVFRLLPEYVNDPRVGNHVRCFMRFVFANYQIIGTSDCVVCGDDLIVNRSYNFCNTCKAWPIFSRIWVDVQKETRSNNLEIVSKRRCIAFERNRRLKKEQIKRRQTASFYATAIPQSSAAADEKKNLMDRITDRDRQLARSGAGKQPRLAFKTPKACHISSSRNTTTLPSVISSSIDNNQRQRRRRGDPVRSRITVNPMDVISFQVVSTPSPLATPDIPPLPSSSDMEITFSVDTYEDEAVTIDFG